MGSIMTTALLTRLFGSRNQRLLKQARRDVAKINQFASAYTALSDAALQAKTQEFKARLQAGEQDIALLPEAFAAVREASVRTLGLRHFDVQLLGGIFLYQGKIAEMCTGEGKTLVATLPAYLNALTGHTSHIITVNDYLAQRDAAWMAPVYQFLGLTVGVILTGGTVEEKKQAYAANIVYGTNNEFGFDYLRDNMTLQAEQQVQGQLHYAIVDEVDSVLIDEARTPLIISGPVQQNPQIYEKINALTQRLLQQAASDPEAYYHVDEKNRQVFLTEQGHAMVESLTVEAGLLSEGDSLYDVQHIGLMHHINAALRAHCLYKRDVDYIVRDQQVVIVDEHTGRTMEGRRWSEGLHSAMEAKEGVPIQSENQTLASITFQNYFRLYAKLAGMTGTADTEAFEFQAIYRLEVVVVPTNKPLARQDLPDQVYLNQKAKYQAVLADIRDRHEKGQPILVGTASIDSSEYVSRLLKQAGIAHQVLNAKYHEKEAHVIAQAGVPGAVTIATNMAGRGTDIVLGGNKQAWIADLPEEATQAQRDAVDARWQAQHEKVKALGGLHVLGTERHESRRIDNQLRGRAGRQGDPGSSQFYLSLEDNLMRIFASDRVSDLMKRVGMQENEAVAHPWITRAIENAQRKVEGHHFDIRKQLLRFDDVANEQRKVIYHQRQSLLDARAVHAQWESMRQEVATTLVKTYLPPESYTEQWNLSGLMEVLEAEFGVILPNKSVLLAQGEEAYALLAEDALIASIVSVLDDNFNKKQRQVGPQIMSDVLRMMMLEVLDHQWKEHLAAMDHLRQGIHLRSYAQKDPVQEFKRESFLLFSQMLEEVKHIVVSRVALLRIEVKEGSGEETNASQQVVDTPHRDAASATAQPLPPIAITRDTRKGEHD